MPISVAVEFDTFNNGPGVGDPNPNHVAVDTGGNLNGSGVIVNGQSNCANNATVTGTPNCMANGDIWSVWIDYDGTSVVSKVLDGRANLVELRVQGPAGRIEGASLRLYNPQARQWNLNYASVRNGALTRPVYGGFQDGRGEFFGQDEFDGRAILVRFVISDVSADSARFEQAYSDDGGKTWETNWIAIDIRVK